MKDVWIEEDNPTKKSLNRKKLIITILIIVAIVTGVILIGVYNTNRQARNWIDKNIFRKEVQQDKVLTIELKDMQSSNIYAFNKYIGILNKTKFSIYGNSGNEEKVLEMQISNPTFSSAGRFLVVGENKGQKVYLVTDKEITWETEVEGNIEQVYVNKNGYVAVVISNTSQKAIINFYEPQGKGKEKFKTYLSSARAVDVSVSNDNKYLAIAEVDTSGTMIQSSIRVISIEKASTDPRNSVENTYKSEGGKLLTNIKYQDKNKLVCMYTDSIAEIKDGENTVLVDNKNKKVTFQTVNLDNHAVSVEEKSSGLFTADSIVNIVNTENKEIKQYVADYVTKELYGYGNIIALNLGTEAEFINSSGWLVKRYVANQEITNIVVSDSIAGIIYRDKIEVINL